jgi:hypothetical protein
MTVVADTLAWVGAIGGAVGAAVAIISLYGVFKWFRPKFRARIDGRRQGIRVDVVNEGRAEGRIRKVALVDEQLGELDARCAGLNDGRFHPAEIPGRSKWFLIIEALRETGAFPMGARILVAWGRRKERLLELEPTENVIYYGLTSDWPE